MDKAKICIALLNAELDSHALCPGNYDVEYAHGWFYVDEAKFQRPDLTAQADKILRDKTHHVKYSRVWNTFVLVQN